MNDSAGRNRSDILKTETETADVSRPSPSLTVFHSLEDLSITTYSRLPLRVFLPCMISPCLARLASSASPRIATTRLSLPRPHFAPGLRLHPPALSLKPTTTSRVTKPFPFLPFSLFPSLLLSLFPLFAPTLGSLIPFILSGPS